MVVKCLQTVGHTYFGLLAYFTILYNLGFSPSLIQSLCKSSGTVFRQGHSKKYTLVGLRQKGQPSSTSCTKCPVCLLVLISQCIVPSPF